MEDNNSVWPLPKFSFSVDLGGQTNLPFQEVSGLDTETQIINYRQSNTPLNSAIKLPGLRKFSNVTLKRGVLLQGAALFDWYNQAKMNTINRETIVIKLLDEKGNPTMTWTLNNAWPTKITGTDLKSEGNEVAVESVEVAFETMVISAG